MLINLSEAIDKRSILSRPFKGKVVDNNDPKKLGRVKCIIEGLLELGNEDLPWITQNSNAFLGGMSGKGILAVPEVGAELKIEFPFDDIYSAEYVGYWQSTTTSINDAEDYPNKVGLYVGEFKLTFNKTKKEFKVEHPSGTSVSVVENGDVIVNSAANVKIDSAENIELNGNAGDVLTHTTDPVVDYITGVPTQGVMNVKAGGV